jgi:hypothetical protein
MLVSNESPWRNTLSPSLIVLSDKLEEFGLVHVNNAVIVIEPKEVEYV